MTASLLVTYELPGFTSKADAADMAKPHGLRLKSFKRTESGRIAEFEASTQSDVDAFATDLSYGPLSVEPIPGRA